MDGDDDVEVSFTARYGREIPVGEHLTAIIRQQGRSAFVTLKLGYRLGHKLRNLQQRDKAEQAAARRRRGKPPLREG